MKKVQLFAISVLLLLAPLAAATITVVSPNGGETLVLGHDMADRLDGDGREQPTSRSN